MSLDPLKHIQLNHYYLSQFGAEIANENHTVVHPLHHVLYYNLLTLRLLMSYIYIYMSYIYIYMERLFLMFLDHTQRRSTVGRTPLDE